jgi:hypothetical protein
MKTVTIEVEDNYWLEILNLIKTFPIKIIEEKSTDSILKIPHKIPLTEGEKVLAILQKTGFLGSMPDIAHLSENYKDYISDY